MSIPSRQLSVINLPPVSRRNPRVDNSDFSPIQKKSDASREAVSLNTSNSQTSNSKSIKICKQNKKGLKGSKSLTQLVKRLGFSSTANNSKKSQDFAPTKSLPNIEDIALQRQSTMIIRPETSSQSTNRQESSTCNSAVDPSPRTRRRIKLNPFLNDSVTMENLHISSPCPSSLQSSNSVTPKKIDALDKAIKKEEKKMSKDHKNNKSSKIYDNYKSTGKAFFDVKKSLKQRITRKLRKSLGKKSQFVKLEQDSLLSPASKLYSPFGICDDSRLMRLRENQSLDNDSDLLDSSIVIKPPAIDETPKRRIALQHLKHVTNKFAFDSPTGKFKDTVKDVENFQQCIEDISLKIKNAKGEAGF